MNLNSLKNLDFTCYSKATLFSGFWESFDYTLHDNVILSCYSVSHSHGMRVYILSITNSLKGTVFWSNTYNPNGVEQEYNTLRTISGIQDIRNELERFDVLNIDKITNTLNSLSNKYGNLYLYVFGSGLSSTEESIETFDFDPKISNSFHVKDTADGSGIISTKAPFDIGPGTDYAGVNDPIASFGKLLEKADGNLETDIGEPDNPLSPTPEDAGILVFRLGSAGTGNGYNTYKLTWNVEKDSNSVNYSEMDFSIDFYQDSLETKGGQFKKQKVGKSGSIDFSYVNAVGVAGWSWLDKLKDKLPIVDPNPTLLSINFYVNDVKLFSKGLPCLLYYDGSVKIIAFEQVKESITWTDEFGNKYTLTAGNNAGENNKNDMDDDDKDKDDDEKGDGDDKKYTGGTDSVNGSALLTTSYSLTISEAHSFGSWLWSSTMIDDIHLVNNNPIENIVACKLFPFSVGGTESSIQLGNVTSNVTGQKLAENVARTFPMNGGKAIQVPKYYSSPSVYGGKYAYLDNAPFTSCRIYLPYLGIKELDASEVLGKDLYIKYYVDLVTGMCRAVIQTDKRSLYVFDGQIGQDVPITASNRAQVEVGYITGGLQSATQIAMGAMTGNVFGVISGINGAINTATNQYHSETHGTPTPCNSRFDSQIAYIIVDRPDLPNIPSKFAHQNGRICNKTLTISNLSGYTELDNTVDLSGIQCTDTERSELLTILSSGFYA